MTPTTEAGRVPTTKVGRALFTDNEPGDMWESTVVPDDICDVEAEAAAQAVAAERERPVYAALMALYEAVGAAPATTETPRQRKVLEAWRAAHALLADPAEPEEVVP